jgi:hypothetical protein
VLTEIKEAMNNNQDLNAERRVNKEIETALAIISLANEIKNSTIRKQIQELALQAAKELMAEANANKQSFEA